MVDSGVEGWCLVGRRSLYTTGGLLQAAAHKRVAKDFIKYENFWVYCLCCLKISS